MSSTGASTILSSRTTPIGDILEGLRPEDLRISPALAHPQVGAALRAAPGISNQDAINAMKAFYAAHQSVVDTSTLDTKGGAQNHPSFVNTMNGYSWKSQQLTADEQNSTQNGIFGASSSQDGGIWGPTIDHVKADQIFTTIGAGINADVQFFVGGAGGLGCAWDIAKREGPRGYGFATAELGLRVVASLNLQCLIFNQLPSDLNMDIWGVKVSIDMGLSLAFSVFFQSGTTTPMGYAIGAGVGAGGGATVFGGHIWNFG